MAGLAAARVSGGSEFHAAGPACEKASPNLVLSRDVTYLLLEIDHRPVRVAGRTDDVSEIRRASASVYSVHESTYRGGIIFVGDVNTVAPTGSMMMNYITAGFAVLFAVLCIVIIIVCSVQLVQLKRYRRNG